MSNHERTVLVEGQAKRARVCICPSLATPFGRLSPHQTASAVEIDTLSASGTCDRRAGGQGTAKLLPFPL